LWQEAALLALLAPDSLNQSWDKQGLQAGESSFIIQREGQVEARQAYGMPLASENLGQRGIRRRRTQLLKELFPGNRAFQTPGGILTEGKKENFELCKKNPSRWSRGSGVPSSRVLS